MPADEVYVKIKRDMLNVLHSAWYVTSAYKWLLLIAYLLCNFSNAVNFFHPS